MLTSEQQLSQNIQTAFGGMNSQLLNLLMPILQQAMMLDPALAFVGKLGLQQKIMEIVSGAVQKVTATTNKQVTKEVKASLKAADNAIYNQLPPPLKRELGDTIRRFPG
jgi:hypothetical protein